MRLNPVGHAAYTNLAIQLLRDRFHIASSPQFTCLHVVGLPLTRLLTRSGSYQLSQDLQLQMKSVMKFQGDRISLLAQDFGSWGIHRFNIG